jgi:hypothetical protein
MHEEGCYIPQDMTETSTSRIRKMFDKKHIYPYQERGWARIRTLGPEVYKYSKFYPLNIMSL